MSFVANFGLLSHGIDGKKWGCYNLYESMYLLIKKLVKRAQYIGGSNEKNNSDNVDFCADF